MKQEPKIQTFTDLIAWQQGHKLVVDIYKLTKDFPKDEQFGLISQMRRSAVSVTSNLAEGFSRRGYKDKAQFYTNAQGSVTELQNQILIAKDVGFIKKQEFNKLVNGLIKSTREKVYA